MLKHKEDSELYLKYTLNTSDRTQVRLTITIEKDGTPYKRQVYSNMYHGDKIAYDGSTYATDATMIALILAQGGEFALLMLQTMKSSGIAGIPVEHKDILTAVVVLSIMVTPLLLCLHDYLQRTGKILSAPASRANSDTEQKIKPDVIVCGFGRVGQIICQMLDAQRKLAPSKLNRTRFVTTGSERLAQRKLYHCQHFIGLRQRGMAKSFRP